MNLAKKLVIVVILVALLVTMTVNLAACSPRDTLIIYNWGDYIDIDVLDEFEDYYFETTGKKIKVIYSTFDTNEVMLTQIMDGKEIVDLICPSEYAIQRLLVNGYLQPIDKEKISTINNINTDIYDKTQEIFTPDTVGGKDFNDYYVPYMWGTLGILYNTQKITQSDIQQGWGLLWNSGNNPLLNVQDRVFMKDSIRDVYVAAVLRLKELNALPDVAKSMSVEELINCTDPALMSAVETLLLQQKSINPGYEVDTGKDEVVEGRVYVNLAWSGDAFYAIEVASNQYKRDLAYLVPNEEGNVWFDGWVIHKSAKNVDAAHMFLDFVCRPEIAMANAIEIGYTAGISATALQESEEAMQLLQDNGFDASEFFADSSRYPNINSDNYGVMRDFGDKEKALKLMWQNVKIR